VRLVAVAVEVLPGCFLNGCSGVLESFLVAPALAGSGGSLPRWLLAGWTDWLDFSPMHLPSSLDRTSVKNDRANARPAPNLRGRWSLISDVPDG
jgi:hypothetical protein